MKKCIGIHISLTEHFIALIMSHLLFFKGQKIVKFVKLIVHGFKSLQQDAIIKQDIQMNPYVQMMI